MKQSKIVWVILTALAFGTMEIALKIGGNAFSPLQLTFLRFLVGGLVLLPFAIKDLKARQVQLSKKDFGFLALLGVVNIVVSMTLFQMSVMHANANMAAVLISLNPLFTMIFAHFVASERFGLQKAIVLAICMTGLVFVANPLHLAQGNEPFGIMVGLGSSVAFGLYTALSKRAIGRMGGLTINTGCFLFGALFEFILLCLLGEPILQGIGGDTIAVLSYICLVVTGGGYYCFMRAVETGGASTASYAFFIKPIIAMLLAALILGEVITWNIVLGIALIVGGFVFNVYFSKKHALPLMKPITQH